MLISVSADGSWRNHMAVISGVPSGLMVPRTTMSLVERYCWMRGSSKVIGT